MKVIVISYPKNLNQEHKVLNSFFEGGLEYFHIRKPDMSTSEMNEYIEKIPDKYHNRIIIHSNYELLQKFNLKGIHFTGITKYLINKFENVQIQKSISCHQLDELKQVPKNFSYTFLAPIFNSISKKDYTSIYSLQQIKEFLLMNTFPYQVIALGGIDENNIEQCVNIGFDGVALLGALWTPLRNGEKIQKIEKKFEEIREICSNLAHM